MFAVIYAGRVHGALVYSKHTHKLRLSLLLSISIHPSIYRSMRCAHNLATSKLDRLLLKTTAGCQPEAAVRMRDGTRRFQTATLLLLPLLLYTF